MFLLRYLSVDEELFRIQVVLDLELHLAFELLDLLVEADLDILQAVQHLSAELRHEEQICHFVEVLNGIEKIELFNLQLRNKLLQQNFLVRMVHVLIQKTVRAPELVLLAGLLQA